MPRLRRRGDLWSPAIRRGAPSRGAPARQRACPAGAPLSFQRKRWERKGRGESSPRRPPKNGGSWRRCAAFGLQRPAAHRRPFYCLSCYRRCRASGGTHRDYPANPVGCCAVPAWPAGPPSVPCLRKTLVVVVIISVGATCGRPPRAEGALRRRPKLRIVRIRVNAKAHSLRWASFSPPNPLRWASAGPRPGRPARRRVRDAAPYGREMVSPRMVMEAMSSSSTGWVKSQRL